MAKLEVGIDMEGKSFHKDLKPQRFVTSTIQLDSINVLAQPRKTFESIDTLAESIVYNGLIYPPVVAKCTEDSVKEHLAVINELWNRNHEISDLVDVIEDGERNFYILVAGERRFRACQHLATYGCQNCQEQFGPGGCYDRHFENNLIEVRYKEATNPWENLDVQFSENIHMRVPPHEEASAYDDYFKLKRLKDPHYTLTQFARDVGRSPNTIRIATRYCELPTSVQTFVEDELISYGIACEITRLQNEGILEEDLLNWALNAVIGHTRLTEFRQKVTNYITERNNGQTSMLDLFNEVQRSEMEKNGRRQTVAQHMIPGIWQLFHYMGKVQNLHERGILGQKDSPYAEGSPRRILLRLVETQLRDLGLLKSLLSTEKFEIVRTTAIEIQDVLLRFED